MTSFEDQQRPDGAWEPAMPLPFMGLWNTCACGSRHWTMKGYKRHWRQVHLLQEIARRETPYQESDPVSEPNLPEGQSAGSPDRQSKGILEPPAGNDQVGRSGCTTGSSQDRDSASEPKGR